MNEVAFVGVDCEEVNAFTDGGVVSATLVSIVTLEASALLLGPVLPASSVTEPDASRRTTSPSVVHTTVTVIVVPEDPDGENDAHEALPEALLKSPEAIPETFSENSRVNESVRDRDGDAGAVQVTVGAVVSTLCADAVETAE